MLEALDREKLQGQLFQHRTPVMVFPASKDDRHNKDPVVIGQSPLDELLNERGACVHDHILSRFPLQTGYDPREVSFHNPRVLPFGLLQEMREDNLLTAIQEARELEQVLRIGFLPRRFGVEAKWPS